MNHESLNPTPHYRSATLEYRDFLSSRPNLDKNARADLMIEICVQNDIRRVSDIIRVGRTLGFSDKHVGARAYHGSKPRQKWRRVSSTEIAPLA